MTVPLDELVRGRNYVVLYKDSQNRRRIVRGIYRYDDIRKDDVYVELLTFRIVHYETTEDQARALIYDKTLDAPDIVCVWAEPD